MHTIFAAGFRSVLLKLGIINAGVHFLGGLVISFVGPVLATILLEKMRMDIFIFPDRYIRFKIK